MKYVITILFLFAFNLCFSQIDQIIKKDSIPLLIKQQIAGFKGYTINQAIKSIDIDKKIVYKIEVQKKTRLVRLNYDAVGNLISKQKTRVYTFDGTEKQSRPSYQNNDGHNHSH